jgi:hypothetical protein
MGITDSLQKEKASCTLQIAQQILTLALLIGLLREPSFSD